MARPWQRVSSPPATGGVVALYAVLATMVFAGVVAAVRLPEHPLVERFAADLSTEALGMLVTVAIIHRLLQSQERSRRLRGSIGSLRRSRHALEELLSAWADLLPAGGRRAARATSQLLAELADPAATEALLGRLLPGSRPAHGDETSGAARLLAARTTLRDVIAAGASLDPLYREALEALADDPLFDLVQWIDSSSPIAPRDWRIRVHATRGLRIRHFDRLRATITLHDRLARQAGRLRARSGLPQTDMLGIDLEPDHDLRIPAQVGVRQKIVGLR